mmetsp:Transcript_999/g.1660  ORF Transcript_999/g.1660 Transcript_999/m.1660 type:complete len:189 (+) Transcript_999:66-632(+)|eukprot:CAMPEP_0174974712 /NCGR_PEP_ID=MMETSP0004_2-20121128/12008_1 /TAXON_ID=420556 /ORGANISM="Ochromonas sp., Strain CCMP1393" /LENGTH=188 /DNA_ID=CAMNT_0016225419 /DNA_START=59 /DNA_END=625 /DNA_ORIENTATION=-
MPKYAIVEEAAKHCWSKNFMDVFKEFFDEHTKLFIDAPAKLGGEQNLEYYALYQKYLALYEDVLSDYISTLNVSVTDFYRELQDVMNDPDIKDKKLLHFVNYLVASTDYESFYKIMGRAAKRARRAEGDPPAQADSKSVSDGIGLSSGGVAVDVEADSKGGSSTADNKAEGKPSGGGGDAAGSKYDDK